MRGIRLWACFLFLGIAGEPAWLEADAETETTARAEAPREGLLVPGARIRVRIAPSYSIEGLAQLAAGQTIARGDLNASDARTVVVTDPASNAPRRLARPGQTLVGELQRADESFLHLRLAGRPDTVEIPRAAVTRLQVSTARRSRAQQVFWGMVAGGALAGALTYVATRPGDNAAEQRRSAEWVTRGCGTSSIYPRGTLGQVLDDFFRDVDCSKLRPAQQGPKIAGGAIGGALAGVAVATAIGTDHWKIVVQTAPAAGPGVVSARTLRPSRVALTLRF
jgi:hypothetical protein